jgi:transposase InsO family protein
MVEGAGGSSLYVERHGPEGAPSFNSKLRDELLNGEISFSLAEAQVLIETRRRHFNAVRPHSSLKYRPPAPLGRP